MDKHEITEVYEGRSRKKAINLFCRECMGYDGHRVGGKSLRSYNEATQEVANCPCVACPLYPYRFSHKITPVTPVWL